MEAEITRAIKDAGGRNLQDNISDLRAQVAANKKGIDLVRICIRISLSLVDKQFCLNKYYILIYLLSHNIHFLDDR